MTDKHIKIQTGDGSFVWGRQESENTATVVRTPLYCWDVDPGDLVRFDGRGHLVEVIEPLPRQYRLRYVTTECPTPEQVQERWAVIQEFLESYDIAVQDLGAGVCSITVPAELDDVQLASLVEVLRAELITDPPSA